MLPPTRQWPVASIDPWAKLLRGPWPRGAEIAAEVWRAHLAFQDAVRGMVSVDQVYAARDVVEQAERKWAKVAGRLAVDGDQWGVTRAQTRLDMEEHLRRVLSSYEQVLGALAVHQQVLVDLVRERPPLIGPVVSPADPAQVFRVPFGLDSASEPGEQFDTMDIADRSFASREIGHLIVDADLRSDTGGTWGLNALFGILPVVNGTVGASCGASVPVTGNGRLRVTATLQNFYSRVHLALRDEWGFSSGRLVVDVTAFIAVLRPDGGETIHRLLATGGLVSHGSELAGQLPEIEQAEVRLEAITEGGFSVGETVTVLAGVCVAAGSVLNDMESDVRALLWWGLTDLSVQSEA